MRLLLICAALGAISCATSSEDVSATPCGSDGGRRCPDVGATSESSVELDGDIDSSTPSDGSIVADDSDMTSGDAIFPVEDTALEDLGPKCDGGGTFCAGDAGGCKDLTKDPSNCGACGKTCPTAINATVTCASSKCNYTCKTGFDDCDGTTGCEVNLQTDESNCGACGTKCATGEVCTAGVCKATTTLIEGFESGTWPWTPWVTGNGTSTGTALAGTCTHDGTRGYSAPASAPAHYYRTDVSVGASGTKVTAWAIPGTGRVYLGFGASASGAYSLVVAPNTSQLMIEREIPYGTYTAVISKSRTWTATAWHKLEITFGAGGLVTGKVYAADGVTLLDTLSTTIAGLAPGGVAFRAFGSGTCIDTISR